MKISEVLNAQTLALNYTEVASNNIPYLGTGFFPAQKKAGLDLKWLKGHKGLPVSLMPSNFDTKSTFRNRIGVNLSETEMAFFRESMLVKESDEQEIMRIQDSKDPYAAQVLQNIFNDSRNLIDGADVVPERMRMQLLAPLGGNMGIEITANGTNYAYNYDSDGGWKAKHYLKIVTDADKWTASETCDPLRDLETALDAQEGESGNRPEVLLMSSATFKLIKNAKKVQSGLLAQNVTANVNYTSSNYTSSKIKGFIEEELNVSIIVYSKKYKDESGVDHKFYPDNIIMMLPNGALGNTYYGTTPEERTLSAKENANVSIVNTGVAVSVIITEDPVNTKTTVSEIVLPSFERMDECYALEVAGD